MLVGSGAQRWCVVAPGLGSTSQPGVGVRLLVRFGVLRRGSWEYVSVWDFFFADIYIYIYYYLFIFYFFFSCYCLVISKSWQVEGVVRQTFCHMVIIASLNVPSCAWIAVSFRGVV